MSVDIKLKKLQDFSQRVNEKRDFHHKKWDRARKSETMDFHFKRYRLFDNISYRITKLFFSLRRNRRFGEVSEWMKADPEFYKKQKRKSKEEGKLKFDSNYRVYLHFMSESLSADYGTHTCDKCSRTFHHSPATVYLGKKKKYSNCCGYCVNNMLSWNRQELVYH